MHLCTTAGGMRSFLFMDLKNRTKMENIKKIKEALELARSLIDMAYTEEWDEIDNAIKICTEAINKNAVLPHVSVAYELLKEVLQYAEASQISLPIERIEKFVSEYER